MEAYDTFYSEYGGDSVGDVEDMWQLRG